MVLRSQCRHPTLSPAPLSESIFVLLVTERPPRNKGGGSPSRAPNPQHNTWGKNNLAGSHDCTSHSAFSLHLGQAGPWVGEGAGSLTLHQVSGHSCRASAPWLPLH